MSGCFCLGKWGNMRKDNIKSIWNNYKRIFMLLWVLNKGSVISILSFTLLLGVLPNVSTLLMKKMMNLLQTEGIKFELILEFVGLYIIVDLILAVIGNLSNYVSSVYQQKLSVKMELMILEKTESLGLKDFESSDSYDMIQRAQTQGGMQVFTYFSHITKIIQYIIMAIGAGMILFTWNIWVIFIVLIIAVLNALVLARINEMQFDIIKKRTGETREKWYYQFVLTNDIAFKEIKTYGLHRFFLNKFENIAIKFFRQDKKIAGKIAFVGNVRVVIEQVIDFIILGKIFYDTYLKKIMLGDTAAFIKCIATIKGNVNGLSVELVNVYRETLFISQLFDYLDMDSSERNEGKTVIKKIDAIEIRNLCYKYPGTQDYALKDVSLKVNGRDKLVIVGRNGSGKTTLVKIIAGFYEDYEGEIFINGIELKQIDKNSLRKRIGLLFQDYTKYEMPARENVAAGSIEYLKKDDILKSALRNAKAPDRLIENLDMQLGGWFRNGSQLSGGEWLRVGISRVFLRNADVYILDEPNAALDSIGESEIFKSVKEVVKNKMSLIITHRIGSIKALGGSIVVMDHGSIIDTGCHDMLLEKCAVYREMYISSVEL